MNGYKIIDFKGIDVSNGGTVPGVYNAVITANKPLIFENLNLFGEGALTPFYAGIMVNTGGVLDFALSIPSSDSIVPLILELDTDDSITIIPIS